MNYIESRTCDSALYINIIDTFMREAISTYLTLFKNKFSFNTSRLYLNSAPTKALEAPRTNTNWWKEIFTEFLAGTTDSW